MKAGFVITLLTQFAEALLPAKGYYEIQRFLDYQAKNGKRYTEVDEFNRRMELFLETDKYINDFVQPMMSIGHNQFSDWTEGEKAFLLP